MWDASMLDTFQSCFYKFNVRYNLNKVAIGKPEALDRGDIFHYGKDPYYQALAQGKPWDEAMEAGLLGMRMRAAEESELEPAEIDRLTKILEENCKFWRPWDLEIDIVAVEQPFSYVLFEDEVFRIIMTGKIDLMFSNRQYTNCPMDTKSYSKDYPLKRFRNQFMNYAVATSSNYLFVDRVGLQGLPGEVKKPMEPSEKHKRQPLSFDKEIKEQWKADVVKWAMLYYDCETNKDWPRNMTSCDKFNKDCEYLEDLCNTAGEVNKAFKLNTNFKDTTPWDPTKVHGKKS